MQKYELMPLLLTLKTLLENQSYNEALKLIDKILVIEDADQEL